MSRRFIHRTGAPPVIDNAVAGNAVTHNLEEIEMGKPKNVEREHYGETGTRRGGGAARVLLVVVGLVAVAMFAMPVLSGYLAEHATEGAGAVGDINVGAWAVGIVLALFLGWCFTSGSKGGR